MNSMRGKLSGVVLLGLVLALVSGCGGKSGKVSGTVTHKGTPLGNGTVVFHPKGEGHEAGSSIHEDGTYLIEDAPVGEVTITVETIHPGPTRPMPPGVPGGDKMAPHTGKYVPIPIRYKDVSNSGLTYTVTPGEQKHDIQVD